MTLTNDHSVSPTGKVCVCVCVVKDEECLRPGDASDITFLEKMEDTLGGHAHFVTLVKFTLMYT